MLHLKRLVVFLDALKRYTGEWKETRAKEIVKAEVISVAQLMERMGKKVAGINLLEIESYLKRSKACRTLPLLMRAVH